MQEKLTKWKSSNKNKEERTRALEKQRMEDKFGLKEKNGNNELLAKSKAAHLMRRLDGEAG